MSTQGEKEAALLQAFGQLQVANLQMRHALSLPMGETPEDDQIALEALTAAGRVLTDRVDGLLEKVVG